MRLSFIPLTVALLPFAAIHLCYLLAAASGHVPWCIPYIDACTAISALGRRAPESFVFRATIIPSAVLMMVYWVLVREWLKTLHSRMTAMRHTMLVFGLVASLGLIVYATVLGEIGEGFTLQRRLGVRLFFALTILAQLLMAIEVFRAARARPDLKLVGMARALVALPAATVLIGLVSLLLWAYYEAFDRIEHAFAWWVTLLVFLHPVLTHCVWKKHGFEARFGLR